MAIRFASAVSFRTPEKFAAKLTAEELSNAQNLSNEKSCKDNDLLKISADQIIENTVKLWMNHGK